MVDKMAPCDIKISPNILLIKTITNDCFIISLKGKKKLIAVHTETYIHIQTTRF